MQRCMHMHCAQIAPVVDASSAQSRADVLAIGLSAVLLLQGLQWLSLAPKPLTAVPPDADFVEWLDPALPAATRRELEWCAAASQLLLLSRLPKLRDQLPHAMHKCNPWLGKF